MSESPSDASGPLDVPTLEVLADRAIAHPLVTDVTFQPDSISPRLLEVAIDAAQYPGSVMNVRLDIRWFEGGDHSIHYVETTLDGHWQCRWDRHSKPDAPTAHFHPPPDAGTAAEPSSIDAEHPLAVLFAVLERVEDRVREQYGD